MKKILKLISWVFILLLLSLFTLWLIITRPVFSSPKSDFLVKNTVSNDLLEKHVKQLSVNFLPRDYANVTNLNKTAAYIKAEFEDMGLSVEEQKYTYLESEYKNIIVHLGPSEGAKIIVGAHYDVAGELPGADDNASGVAGLIELTRALKDKPLTQGITLVAYTLEEPPVYNTQHMGSYVHAKSEYAKGSDIELMISLEMIGYFSDESGSQTFPIKALEYIYPTTGDYIVVADILLSNWGKRVKKGLRQHTSIPVHSINAPKTISGIDFSDHRNYWNFGYDAVMISDTAFYRNKAYHTKDDTYERLNYGRMSQIVNALAKYLTFLSND